MSELEGEKGARRTFACYSAASTLLGVMGRFRT